MLALIISFIYREFCKKQLAEMRKRGWNATASR
jgi:hypothetical protein